MVNKEDRVRSITLYTKNGNKYGQGIYKCKHCSKEITINNSILKTHSGYCRDCSDKYDKVGLRLNVRTCKVCDMEQSINQFTSGNNKYSKLTCHKCYSLKKYNLNYKKYLNLLVKQNNTCAICHSEEFIHHSNRESKLSLAVDHDHITKKVRGLLCGNCNRAIGLLKDNPVLLTNAITYLNK